MSSTAHYGPARTPRPATGLTGRTLVSYGSPAAMLAAMSITFYIYLPKFYVDVLGINLGTLGLIILASRLWDAVTDPTIGALSDRTRTRWGRRRPWMLAAAVPLATTFFLLSDPLMVGSSELVIAVLSFLFFLSWTAVTIPYESLGPEISFDYDERNRLFGVRESLVIAGTVLAAALPALLPPESFGLRGYGAVGIIYGVALVAAVLLCFSNVREHRWLESQQPSGSPWKTIKGVMSNQPFVLLLGSYTMYSLGGSLATTVFLFFAEHVLGTDRGPVFLVIYLIAGIVFLPAWIALSKRWEKKSAWIASLSVSASAFAGVGFLGRGDEVLFGILVALSGIGLGGIFAIPPSMQADTIDYDEMQSGIRREGQYVGIWAFAKKLAMAMGAGFAFPLLDISGYMAGGANQPETTILALRWLYVGVPVICNLLAIGLVLAYPITREKYREISAKMDLVDGAT